MTLSMQLPDDVEANLRVRASASGEPLDTYVSKLLQHFAALPTPPEEISGPIQQQFLKSGTTEKELVKELQSPKHKMCFKRRSRQV